MILEHPGCFENSDLVGWFNHFEFESDWEKSVKSIKLTFPYNDHLSIVMDIIRCCKSYDENDDSDDMRPLTQTDCDVQRPAPVINPIKPCCSKKKVCF